MSKRRRKRRQRNRAGGAPDPAAGETAGTTTETPAAAQPPTPNRAAGRSPRAPIVPWRDRVRALLDGVRGFAREHRHEAVEGLLKHAFGDPPAPEHPADAERLIDDFVCTPGSAGDGRSVLRAFCEDAPGIDSEGREQALRWETERRRGVFLVQRCFADRVELWDPLEGAGLTLSLLERMPPGRAAEVRRGTVVTMTYLPFQARLIALGLIEMYGGDEALQMFREQVRSSGQAWHDAPPSAPTPS